MYYTFWLLTWRIAEGITLGGLQLFKTWNLVTLGAKIAECITLGGLQLNAATQQFLKELQKFLCNSSFSLSLCCRGVPRAIHSSILEIGHPESVIHSAI